MNFAILFPDFLKPILRPIFHFFVPSRYKRKKTYSHGSSIELHQYWRQHWDGLNLPQDYLDRKAQSQFLVELMKKYVKHDEKIIEIGCNIGRNLNYLFQNGFKNLEGLEISEEAVKQLKEIYPEMASHTYIYTIPVEEKIREFRDCEFDVVFTMAVLAHIHTDNEWVFQEMVRITKDFLIVVEDEHGRSWRHYPRDYKKIFESFRMEQIEEINCAEIHGLDINFFARIFKRVL